MSRPEYREAALRISATPAYRESGELVAYLDKQREIARDILSKAGVLKEK